MWSFSLPSEVRVDQPQQRFSRCRFNKVCLATTRRIFDQHHQTVANDINHLAVVIDVTFGRQGQAAKITMGQVVSLSGLR